MKGEDQSDAKESAKSFEECQIFMSVPKDKKPQVRSHSSDPILARIPALEPGATSRDPKQRLTNLKDKIKSKFRVLWAEKTSRDPKQRLTYLKGKIKSKFRVLWAKKESRATSRKRRTNLMPKLNPLESSASNDSILLHGNIPNFEMNDEDQFDYAEALVKLFEEDQICMSVSEDKKHQINDEDQFDDEAIEEDQIRMSVPIKKRSKPGATSRDHIQFRTYLKPKSLERAPEIIVDVNMLVESMKIELENLHLSTNSLRIYKIPEQLRELNEKAYTPRLVSIGPFHHGKQNLKPMEDNKKIYLQEFLSTSRVGMKTIFKAIKRQETKLHDCYAASIELDRVAFLKMMLVDGAFILNYLLKRYQGTRERNDQVFNQQCLTNTIRFDILLLENQLPFFFLKQLLELSAGKSVLERNGVSLIKMVYSFLKGSIGWDWLEKGNVDSSKFEGIRVKHLVHFLSVCLQPSDSIRGKELKIRTTPTIAQLHSAGVKFQSSSSKHFLDIEFKNGILQIPNWKINDSTEIVFRNLMAFEQLNLEGDHYLSDYAALMDMLIDDSKDVELLVRNGIIEHWLQDNQEVATLVNGLGKYNIIKEDEFLFADLIENLNKYYNTPWHHYKATFKQQYLKNPWTVISVIAAGFLLLLTVVQTVCSILPVL